MPRRGIDLGQALAAAACLMTVLLSGCGSGGSSAGIEARFDPIFHQEDLAGTWSGTEVTEFADSTLVLQSDATGTVFFGLTSRLSNVVWGDLVLVDDVTGAVEFFYLDSHGREVEGWGFLNGDELDLNVTDNQGNPGTILLDRGYGLRTFGLDQLAGSYELELRDQDQFLERSGFLVMAGGKVVDGKIGGVLVIDGQLQILDTTTGIYRLFVLLANGNVIVVDGLISLYDGMLAGLYSDDTVAGHITLYPSREFP